MKDREVNIPLIVSNKHVLCNKAWIELDFALADGVNSRIIGPSKKIRIRKSVTHF